VNEKPGGGPPERGRGERAAPRRSRGAEVEKVAPWRQWKRLSLRASAGGDPPVTFTVSGLDPDRDARYSKLITTAAYKHFKIEKPPREGEGPTAYLVGAGRRRVVKRRRDRDPAPDVVAPGRLRVVYDELIVRFEPGVPPARCDAILAETGFRGVGWSCVVENRWIVRHAQAGVAGEALLAAAEALAPFEEVRYAWPNSVAEYVKASDGVPPKARRWWLDKINVNWQTGTRRLAKGDSDIVVAVLDDGVDIVHPNLESRVAEDPGRDYAFPPSDPTHTDPTPKRTIAGEGDESDYHGTECAGVICSDGSEREFFGVAPGCTLVAVRVIDGPELISELSLADAFRYATGVADVISCSWVGEEHEEVASAIDDTIHGRDDKGTVLVCAVGNDEPEVAFPARHDCAIAVGACGPAYEVTTYSTPGTLDVVAPSSFEDTHVYSTDVSAAGLGLNPGEPGDSAGLFWKEFGRTSAATATTAGVAALCLSANPNLTAAQVRSVLRETADQVGIDEDGNDIEYDPQTHRSQEFGYGCIDAAAAYDKAKDMLGP
jgi:subtilisin family serine protease